MARIIQYRVDGGSAQGSISPADPITISGLTNDSAQGIEIRVVDDGVESGWSNLKSVTPTAPDVIEVDLMAGADDTERIDNAIDKATDSGDADFGKEIHFGAGEYDYVGTLTISAAVTLVGTQPIFGTYTEPTKTGTTINTDSRWTFSADVSIRGIWLDAGRNDRKPFYLDSGATLTGERLYLSGAYTDVNDYKSLSGTNGGAFVLRIDTGNLTLKDSKVFDAQWDGDLTTADAFPLVRVIDTTSELNEIDFDNVQIFGCCDDLTLYSGTKLIESSAEIDDFNNDIDMVNLNGNGTTSTTKKFRNVTFYDCPLTYWKTSNGGGTHDMDGVTFRFRSGKTSRGRILRFQNGNGITGTHFSGTWKNFTIEFDDISDRKGSYSGGSSGFETNFWNMDVQQTDTGTFNIINMELKWSGTLNEPLFLIGRSRDGYSDIKFNNVYHTGGGAVRHFMAVYKKGAESDPYSLYYEIANSNINVDRAWIFDDLEVQPFTFDGSNCRINDEINIRQTNLSNVFNINDQGVESLGATSSSNDVFIHNDSDWQAEACVGTITEARKYQAY